MKSLEKILRRSVHLCFFLMDYAKKVSKIIVGKSKFAIAMLVTVAMLFAVMPLTANAMQLSVRITADSGNSHLALEVEPTDRIEDVKQKIADSNAVPIEDQILVFAGEVLENGNTLQDYAVQKGSTLYLYVGRALNVSDGDIRISETGYSVGGAMETAYNGAYVIYGETTQNTIHIAGNPHNIVLSSLNMRFLRSADLIEIDGGTVNIKQIGENIIQATADGSGAAVKMSDSTELHFYGTGKSTLVGGSNYHGGSHAVEGGSLYIEGGEVTLIGGRKIVNSFGHAFKGKSLIVTGGTMRCGVGYLNDSNYAEPTVSAQIQIYCGTLSRAVAHQLQYSQDGAVITEKCVCGHEETATLTPPTNNIVYDGLEKRGAMITYSNGWASGELTVTYSNNVNAGTATASIAKDGKTATVHFSIDKAEQLAPAVGKADETIAGKNDGKIIGITDQMEYRKEGENEHTAIIDTTAENLSDGKYYVRMKGDGNHNPSVEMEIIIAPGRMLIVTYKADGNVVATKEVEYGKDVSAPTIPAKDGYTQTAPAWDKDGKNITADAEINAVYTINEYIITFMDENGIYKTLTYKHGEAVTMPEVPAKDGYTVKWETDIDKAIGNATIRAVYTKNSTPAPSFPQTGDNLNLWPWFLLMFASGAGMLVIILDERKRRFIKNRMIKF